MGFEGAFYVGPRGSNATQLAESIRNPKLTYTYSEVDVTTRKHKGTKAYQKGLLDVTITFTLPNIKPRTADAALIFASLMDRKQPIAIRMLDEPGGEGVFGDFELFGGDNSQEDENVQEWEITARPSSSGKPVEWVKGSG